MKIEIPEHKFQIEVIYDYEDIQSFAKENYGRKLTCKELSDMKYYWNDVEDIGWLRYEILAAAIDEFIGKHPTKRKSWKGNHPLF
jgi:hypothetical protein